MKRKILKLLLILVIVIVVGIGGLLTYVKTALPNVGEAPDMKVEATPERVQRGEYLANHVMVCIDCHSQRDWSIFSAPIIVGKEGMGGEVFDENMGFPGKFIAPNITPANIAHYTDGELFRVITTGVAKDGRALFPIMPYKNYGRLDPEDIKSVIAYIRTLKPIENKTGKSAPAFPMNFILNTIPEKANLQPMPQPTDIKAYGKYLVTAAGCYECHTNQVNGEFIGQPYAGGMEFRFPDGSIVRSVNITPHNTGIGSWTEASFVNRFKAYTDSNYIPQKITAGAMQSPMPWVMYSGMKTEDLKAIFAYLQTITPVENTVERFTKANNKF